MENIFKPAYVEQQILASTQLFSVPADIPEMGNIGRKIRFLNPNSPGFGKVHHLVHYIQHLQKNYRGEICYRVQTDEKDFGRVARFNEVEFID